MGRKSKTAGLIRRGEVWHIEKRLKEAPGGRLRESTGTSNLSEAQRYLARRIEECRNAVLYGIRPQRLFEEAAIHYLGWNKHKSSLEDDGRHLKEVMPFVGHLRLEQVHMGTLKPYIEARQAKGIKTKSINNALGVVRHLLNQAAAEWIDDNGLTWIAVPPKIKLLPVHDARKPYPLSWDEQTRLFQELPAHLARMALFKVNTGTREQEVCQLEWDWECRVPELNTSVFIIPSAQVKNREERLVVLNSVAKSIIEEVRGQSDKYVFVYQGRGIGKMNNTAWKRARRVVGLESVRVHDLKHTFGRRLRAAGVPLETRKALLGHRNRDITTHYSAPELSELIGAAEQVVNRNDHKVPTLTMLKRKRAL